MIGERSAPHVVGLGPIIPLRLAFQISAAAREQLHTIKQVLFFIYLFFSLMKVSETPAAPGGTAIPGPR